MGEALYVEEKNFFGTVKTTILVFALILLITSVASAAEIALSKNTNPSDLEVEAGDTVTYYLEVCNPQSSYNMTLDITDTFPNGTTRTLATSVTLNPMECWERTVGYTVTGSETTWDDGYIRNQLCVSGQVETGDPVNGCVLKTNFVADTTPPDSISDISAFFYNTPDGKEVNVYSKSPFYVNWTWNNPPDADFNHTMILIDGKLINTSNNYYLTSFQDLDTYRISTHTVDTSGNINETWVNHTVTVPTLSESTNVTFDDVTKKGITEIESLNTNPGGDPSSGFMFRGYFVDVNTTAAYLGSIEVCINYTGKISGVDSNLRLMHWDGSEWDDVTTSLDSTNNVLCGQVSGLSPFAIASSTTTPSQPVGGEVAPVNKFSTLMPYIIGTVLTLIGGVGIYATRKKMR